jgi:DNA-binding IclR family transcriptional regulator
MVQRKSNSSTPTPIRSVAHSLKLVDALAAGDQGRGVTELSGTLRLAKSTVYRLLQTLVGHGYVVQDPASGRYHLGLKFLELGALVSNRLSILTIARPHLQRLMEATNETVHLGLLEGIEVVYADKIECSRTIRMYSRVGRRSPLHCTALGKALLAHQPEATLRELLRTRLQRQTARTITTAQALRAELQQVRKQGYADDNEEFEEGLRCLAAPIRDHTGTVAASLGIAGPAARVEAARLPELIKLVRDAAEAVSAALGYREVDSLEGSRMAGQGGMGSDVERGVRAVDGEAARGNGMGGLAKERGAGRGAR